MFAGWPATMVKPAGRFMHAFTSVTKKALSSAGERDHHAGGEVQLRRDAVAPVEVDAEEDGLREEGEALQREGQADDLAEHAHEARPEQAELERERRARDGADREEDARPLGHPPGEIPPVRVPGAEVERVGDHHEERQRDAGRRERHVKRQ